MAQTHHLIGNGCIFYTCNIISFTVSSLRCVRVGTSSVIPAVWIASPQGYNNAVDSNQYSAPQDEQIMELQLDSTSLSIPLLVMNQHPLPPEDKKATMHTYTYTHRVREKLNLDPWHLAPDPSVWWPIDYVWPRLGNCCLVITSRVVFGSA